MKVCTRIAWPRIYGRTTPLMRIARLVTVTGCELTCISPAVNSSSWPLAGLAGGGVGLAGSVGLLGSVGVVGVLPGSGATLVAAAPARGVAVAQAVPTRPRPIARMRRSAFG